MIIWTVITGSNILGWVFFFRFSTCFTLRRASVNDVCMALFDNDVLFDDSVGASLHAFTPTPRPEPPACCCPICCRQLTSFASILIFCRLSTPDLYLMGWQRNPNCMQSYRETKWIEHMNTNVYVFKISHSTGLSLVSGHAFSFSVLCQ